MGRTLARWRWLLAVAGSLVIAIVGVFVVARPTTAAHVSSPAPRHTVITNGSSTPTPVVAASNTPTPTAADSTATPTPSTAPSSSATHSAPPPLSLQPAAGTGPSIAGCPVFPADNIWNRDISSLPVDSHSAAWIGNSGGTSRLIHPDFGGNGTANPYGIPYVVVNSGHPKIAVGFQYADESDPGPYPFGADTPIEGGAGSGGDQHAIMLDSSTCTLYELYNASYSPSGSTAGSGAIWSLTSDALRPVGWTSADAAGLPLLPGLLRPDEVAAGAVRHAIRMTVATTDTSYIWPARHQAGSVSNANYPPMGARFRLKANVDISQFSADTQVVLNAMKHYGMIVADNGSNWYFQGAAEQNWDPVMIQQLKTIPAGDFEAVDSSSLMVSANSGQSR